MTTNDTALARVVRILRDWGAEQKYHHDLKGFNYRLEGVQGAVLGVKMAHIERWTEQRRAVAARYDEGLDGTAVGLPLSFADRRHVYHVYAVRTPRREELQRFLAERDIHTGIHYPIPVHLQKAFAELGHLAGDFPESEAAASEVLSLPMYPELGTEQQDLVIAAIRDWSEQG